MWGIFLLIIFLLYILALLGRFIFKILYLRLLQQTLEKIKPENRKISPQLVWLEIIPVFDLAWQFVNVAYISNSLKKELADRTDLLKKEETTFVLGLVTCILSCTATYPIVIAIVNNSLLKSMVDDMLYNSIAAMGSVTFYTIYWLKVTEFKNML
ncbi:MAG: hypothetical protein KF900_08725 [Bacteroidetes bacterium]|nr:hypothetical protein [Bacteroidota bacterium]